MTIGIIDDAKIPMCAKCYGKGGIRVRTEATAHALEGERIWYWIECTCGVTSVKAFDLNELLRWWGGEEIWDGPSKK